MFTDIDSELFADDCEVVEISPHNLNIYRIFKNGSSTLTKIAEKNQYKIFKNETIYQLESVDILLRNPRQRYVAGVDMFIKLLRRDNPKLDLETCIWFANRYAFLNRHYITQFHWLLNLVRFTNPDCQIRLHDFSLLANITSHNDKITRSISDNKIISMIESGLAQKESWFFLDDILIGLQGQSLTWNQIKKIFQEHPAKPLTVATTAMEIFDALQ